MVQDEQAPLSTEKELVKEKALPRSLSQTIPLLSKFGGFDFIKTIVDGTDNMDPTKKARKAMFLEEEENKSDRKKLKKRLQNILDLVTSYENPADMIADAEGKAASASQTLKSNLLSCLDQTAELEASYRSLALFFENTAEEKVKNLTLFDAGNDMTSDSDNFSNQSGIFAQVQKELRDNYDRFDLEKNYSLMIIPGWLKKNTTVDKWAELAHKNRVMLLTDYRHLESAESVEKAFDKDKLTGSDPHKANVMMPCNWIVGRESYTEIGETEHLYVSPSMALAGLLWSGNIAQPAAGLSHGKLKMASGTRFMMRKNEVAELENRGLIPLIYEWGKVIPQSSRTLFDGDNVGLQTYSVVRVFDWIGKVMQDFLNRRTFENVDNQMLQDIQQQISRFLSKIQGPGKIIEDYRKLQVTRDPVNPTHIAINVELRPFFPAKVFNISLTGTKGNWDSDVKE
ncbi:DUF5458 family protein [Dyadobacter sp. CY343]|uniref:DUF5458 family protein n=1 Tax=Dyadobacter sp. CY343 TaxID=2907299 RepID=UPI001F472902|nr:DUF5458 family protein [Dyadobacter sp. CY343]MCE7059238.1 DUF5458 family protein [Dyadobacter sp. CY343]